MENGAWPRPNPQEETPSVGDGGGRREEEKDGGFGDRLWAQPPKQHLGDARKGCILRSAVVRAAGKRSPMGNGDRLQALWHRCRGEDFPADGLQNDAF